tara:strand:- start:831 stop:1484 length:654 start_codon:yes stop_codon:yes gene_type:complete
MKTVKTFLETSFQNVRSSARTKVLHQVILDEVLKAYPEWKKFTWVFEYKMRRDGFEGTFDIDIAGFSFPEENELKDPLKPGGKTLEVAILCKAINSNVNKNIKNYANTTIGEAARLMYAPMRPQTKVFFISYLPRVAPRFNTKGEVVGFDDVVGAKTRTKVDKILRWQYGYNLNNPDSRLVETLDLYYNIADVYEKQTKADFNDIIVEDLDYMCAQE